MKPSLRQASLLVGVGVVLAACGGHGAPPLPAAPAAPPTNSAALSGFVAESPVIVQESSVSAPPAGFKAVVRVDPRPGDDGVIRGESPLTVRFDLCGSTADAGKTLFFVYDWDFDNVADSVGSGTACEQEHTFKAKPVVNAAGDLAIRTNVCVVNGDPGIRNHSAFWACRQYSLALPIPAVRETGKLIGSFLVDDGANWTTNPPTFSCVEACALLFGGSAGSYSCSTDASSIDHQAHLSVWGVGGCLTQSETYKVNTFYNCGSNNCAASAYVQDNCTSGARTNYCFQ